MKERKVEDTWKALYKKKFDTCITKFNYTNLPLIGDGIIEFTGGITAICGINGVGKTTLLHAITSILNNKFTTENKVLKKIKKSEIIGTLTLDKNSFVNSLDFSGESLVLADDYTSIPNVFYLDLCELNSLILFYLQMDNISEILEQHEASISTDDELKNISYIIGKEYKECIVYELDEFEEKGVIPYFIVKNNDITYNSEGMGLGEHSIFFIFWYLRNIPANSILLIEEPETYLSYRSQQTLINYIAFICLRKSIWCIITTHSPAILTKIPNNHIRIISRKGTKTSIKTPKNSSEYLKGLGITLGKKGVIFVEDRASREFAKVWIGYLSPGILQEFDITDLNGDGDIKNALNFPLLKSKDFKVIGLFDGDLYGYNNKHNWGYAFLPSNSAPEKFLKDLSYKNPEKLNTVLLRDNNLIQEALGHLEGDDHHDWFIKFSGEIGISYEALMEGLFILWMSIADNNKDAIDKLEILKFLCYN